MKKAILILIGCLFFGNNMFSQDASNDDKATAMTTNMQSQIGFNDETYKNVYVINLEFVTKTQELKSNGDSKLKKFKALKSIDKDRDKALKTLFTDEEYKKFEANKSDNRAAMKERIKAARD